MMPQKVPRQADPTAHFIAAALAAMHRERISQAALIGRIPYHPDSIRPLSEHLTRSVISRIFINGRFPKPAKAARWYAEQLLRALREAGLSEGAQEELAELENKIAATESHLDAANSDSPERPELPEPEMLSRQAIVHFGLSGHPFADDVQKPEDVFLSTEQRYIAESMWHAARHAGFVAVIGESGSGKSTLRRALIERIAQEGEPVVVLQPRTIDKTRLTAAHICDAIIHDMSDETPRQSLEAKARQVERILTESSRGGNRHCLIVEEAHDLKLPTLKFMKRFWELEDGFRRLIGIILVGQPELGHLLDERRNFSAREVIRRCEVASLQPLNGHLRDYLALKFGRVGGDVGRILAPDAIDAIHERLTISGRGRHESHAYPLVVHNLLARCMNEAVELGYRQIDGDQVRGV